MAPDGTRRVLGACALDCPDTCSWVVTVKDGRAVRLEGDTGHPFTRGVLCNKVNGYVAYTRSPDRLLHPMRRVGPKGRGAFEPVSWEEALDEIAERFAGTIRDFGPESIWPYLGSGSMGLIQGVYGAGRRLWNALGASQHLMTICTIAGGVGTGYTLGDNRVGMDPETLRFSRLVILWGSNTLSTNHHLWRAITAARRQGAYLVVIDPTRTRTADAADLHLAPIPGTDAALALGLMHVVLAEGAEDREFIGRHTHGWDAFRARILEYPPARVAGICGIPAEAVVDLGKRIARTRPTGIRLTMGLQRHGGGGMAVRTITCIPGVTGDWRYPGGGAVYDTRGFFGVNWAALYRDDLRRPGTRSLSMTRLGEGLLEVHDPPVNALFVYASNPLASVPHQIEDPARAGASRSLHGGRRAFPHGHGRVRGHRAARDHAARARRPADLLRAPLRLLERARRGAARRMVAHDRDLPAPREAPGARRAVSLRQRRRDRPPDPRLHASVAPRHHARQAEGARVDAAQLSRAVRAVRRRLLHGVGEARVPLRAHGEGGAGSAGRLHAPYEAAQRDTPLADRFPLALIAGADHYFLNSLFANVADQVRRSGPPVVRIHPEDATARGLETGHEARVFNDRGAFVARVEVTDRVRRGVVASTKGRWPRFAKGGATVNATVDERDADMGGGAVFHDNRVEVERL